VNKAIVWSGRRTGEFEGIATRNYMRGRLKRREEMYEGILMGNIGWLD